MSAARSHRVPILPPSFLRPVSSVPDPAAADSARLSHAAVRIDLDALRANARYLAARASPARLMAVVKADAYGHGASVVARALEAAGTADAFAVATLAEALALRGDGIRGRVLVFAPPEADWLGAYAAHGLDAAVSTDRALDAVLAHRAAGGPRIDVHVKADTGMHRLGFPPADVPRVVAHLRRADVPVMGVWTHLATSSDAFAREQSAALAALAAEVPAVPRHIANSGALLSGDGRLAGRDDSEWGPEWGPVPGETWVRAGLALYGVDPRGDGDGDGDDAAPFDPALRPVLTLGARVVQVRTIAAGETVSYGRTWTAPRPTRIATVALGYADGLPRALSNRGAMAVRGRRYPVAGVVCMDLTMLDLGPPGGPGDAVAPGDIAEAIGGAGPSAWEIARLCGTIPYEILARIGARVPRVAVG